MVLATGAAVGVMASTAAYYMATSSPLLAADETQHAAIDKDANWKERWRARYNDKIKNWSTPEKIFNVFATVRKVSISLSLSALTLLVSGICAHTRAMAELEVWHRTENP
jgi:hypothetical protein